MQVRGGKARTSYSVARRKQGLQRSAAPQRRNVLHRVVVEVEGGEREGDAFEPRKPRPDGVVGDQDRRQIRQIEL